MKMETPLGNYKQINIDTEKIVRMSGVQFLKGILDTPWIWYFFSVNLEKQQFMIVITNLQRSNISAELFISVFRARFILCGQKQQQRTVAKETTSNYLK